MIDAGRIGFVIKGDYNADVQYGFLDVVYYNGESYVAKRSVKGMVPADAPDDWQILADANVSITNAGISVVDGKLCQTYNGGEED